MADIKFSLQYAAYTQYAVCGHNVYAAYTTQLFHQS